MAAVNIWWGMPYLSGLQIASPAGTAFNASTQSFSTVFRSLTTDPITRLAVKRTNLTGTSPTYRLSLQGVNSAGNPDGTVKASGNAAVTFTAAALTNGAINWLTLTSSYTPSAGELLAYVLEHSSGTIDGSNFVTFGLASSGANIRANKFPAYSTGASGVYTRSVNNPCYGYGTSTTAYGFLMNTAASANINSGTPELAGKFVFGTGLTGSFQLASARWLLSTVVGCTVTCSLYDGGGASDTTVLQAVDLDTDAVVTSGSLADFPFDESVLSSLVLGNTYRIALSTADASSQIISTLTTTTAADMECFEAGANFTLSTRNGGNWTDTATTRPLCEVWITDLSPSGGSSAPGGGDAGLIIQARQMISY